MSAFFLAAVQDIPWSRLSLALIPVGVVLVVLNAWSIGVKTSLYAVGRMLAQLLALGFLLTFLFDADSSVLVLATVSVMLLVASWISLRVAVDRRSRFLGRVFLSIAVGGGLTLLIVTQGVLQLEPWYLPRKMIPLAGMIFSNCMNAISLAIERFVSEQSQRKETRAARRTALEASLIPITNSLFAVGLVSIPGMMTGQVLAGADAHIAAKYQVMVMCMMFGSAGISTAMCLSLISRLPTEPLESQPTE